MRETGLGKLYFIEEDGINFFEEEGNQFSRRGKKSASREEKVDSKCKDVI